MSAPNVDPQVLVCRGKRRYPDEVCARANASVICEQFSLEKVNVYPCPHCRGWHVTTDNKGARGRVTADATYVAKTTANRHTPTEAKRSAVHAMNAATLEQMRKASQSAKDGGQ